MGVLLEVRAGYCYEATLPAPDGDAVGARWVGGRPVQGGETGAGPLEPMYRRRLIVKLDDLQSFSVARFQAFVGAVAAHGGKADLGINPGKCGREVYTWLRTLDPSRFEIWNHTWDHGAFGPLHRGLPLEVQVAHLDMVQEKVKREVGLPARCQRSCHAGALPPWRSRSETGAFRPDLGRLPCRCPVRADSTRWPLPMAA